MTTPDLTEKLKEFLMGCDINNQIGKPLFAVRSSSYSLSPAVAEIIAKQLAPEIDKMMPRWIPVSEGLPDEGQAVDVWTKRGIRFTDVVINKTTYKDWRWDNHDYSVQFDSVIYWMPIMKGPM